MKTHWSTMPGSYDPTADAAKLEKQTLPAIITRRGRRAVIAAQQRTWMFFGLKLATDPDFCAEVEQARAGEQAPIVRDKESIVRACVAGELNPDEAVELFRRAQG